MQHSIFLPPPSNGKITIKLKPKPEIIEDAVFKRNLEVEEKYGVDIDYRIFNGYSAGMDSVKGATASVMSGEEITTCLSAQAHIGALCS